MLIACVLWGQVTRRHGQNFVLNSQEKADRRQLVKKLLHKVVCLNDRSSSFLASAKIETLQHVVFTSAFAGDLPPPLNKTPLYKVDLAI